MISPSGPGSPQSLGYLFHFEYHELMLPERSTLYMSPRLLYCDRPAEESSLVCIRSFGLSVFALLVAARSVSPASMRFSAIRICQICSPSPSLLLENYPTSEERIFWPPNHTVLGLPFNSLCCEALKGVVESAARCNNQDTISNCLCEMICEYRVSQGLIVSAQSPSLNS